MRVKTARKQLGVSQRELERMSGITQATISEIESGIIQNPTVATMQAIATALGCTVDELIRPEEQPGNVSGNEKDD